MFYFFNGKMLLFAILDMAKNLLKLQYKNKAKKFAKKIKKVYNCYGLYFYKTKNEKILQNFTKTYKNFIENHFMECIIHYQYNNLFKQQAFYNI
jgi:hypothetical protein